MISIKEDAGNRKVFIKFETIADDILYELQKAWWEIGKLVTRKLSDNILKTKKSGVMYKYKGRSLRASAKGEYPRNRSGFLRKSINFVVPSYAKMEIGLSAPYAEYLQEGTKRMAKRKLLDETIQETSVEQANILEKRLNTAVQR